MKKTLVLIFAALVVAPLIARTAQADEAAEVDALFHKAFAAAWSLHCPTNRKLVGTYEYIPTPTNKKDSSGRQIYDTRLIMNLHCVDIKTPRVSSLAR